MTFWKRTCVLIGLAVVFYSQSAALASAEGASEDKSIAPIRKSLGLKKGSKVIVTEVQRTNAVPFLSTTNESLLVVQKEMSVRRGKQDKSISVRAVFSKDGQFRRVESVQVTSDPWRRNKKAVEKSMRSARESIVGFPRLKEPFDFAVFWEKVSREHSLEDAKEFNLTLVQYKVRDGLQKPVIILKVWGLANPLGMPDELPDGLKNRMRVLLDLEGNVISMDNVL